MGLLSGDAFDNLFRGFRESAFHLELCDTYSTPGETAPLASFLAGRPEDRAWHEPWLRLVREVTATGRRMSRVRVVSEPHSDYTRWALAVAPLNMAAGEDIRWLPRRLAEGIDFPPADYWLFDSERVVFTVFTGDGAFLGGVEDSDACVVERCRRARDLAWERAIPHAEYTSVVVG